MVVMVPRVIPVTVVRVVGGVPVVVVTVVVVPVQRSPGPVVDRVVPPVPVGAPYYVARAVDETDHRPCSYFIVGGGNHRDIFPLDCPAPVARVGCLSIDGFNNVIPSVKSLVTDKLYLYLTVAQLLNGEDCHILVFVAVKNRTHYYSVHIAVGVVCYGQIIHIPVIVQVEVVDP